MKEYKIGEKALKDLVEGFMKYQALKSWNVEEWSHYYDALSEYFSTPKEDYEDYSEIVANFIDNVFGEDVIGE